MSEKKIIIPEKYIHSVIKKEMKSESTFKSFYFKWMPYVLLSFFTVPWYVGLLVKLKKYFSSSTANKTILMSYEGIATIVFTIGMFLLLFTVLHWTSRIAKLTKSENLVHYAYALCLFLSGLSIVTTDSFQLFYGILFNFSLLVLLPKVYFHGFNYLIENYKAFREMSKETQFTLFFSIISLIIGIFIGK